MAASPGAHAETVRSHFYSATSVCEAPLPIYDATLRKRPLGISNEGSDVIFISCSMPGDYVGNVETATVRITVTGLDAGGSVNCTLVGGSRYGMVFRTGSVDVAMGANAELLWDDVDKSTTFGSYNFSCYVPPGVELNNLMVIQRDTFDRL
ncbi:MAG TPA: hypothetical protein VLK29_05290 [Luteimonas sp.]|nr:hypothetical protein [Luteimonas sp.]